MDNSAQKVASLLSSPSSDNNNSNSQRPPVNNPVSQAEKTQAPVAQPENMQVAVPENSNDGRQPSLLGGSNFSQGAKSNVMPQIAKFEAMIAGAPLPPDLHEKAVAMIERLKLIQHQESFFMELDHIGRYIDWICALPWSTETKDILDLQHARQVLDKNHYGLTQVKEQILQYLSVMIIKAAQGGKDHFSRAPIISLVGLAGVGKTTVAYSIAEALGRKIERIPFGGMGAASILRGQSRFSPDAEPGAVIKALRRAGTNNPVILLDEIDRVSAEARGDIMGVLVELLDPEQNRNYSDHFIDYPFNLGNVLFVATSNNTKDISTAVLDRLEVIQMPSYSDQEKIVIAKTYLLPKVLVDSGFKVGDVQVSDPVWALVVRPLGYDPGIRSLQRTVQDLVRKVALFQLDGKLPKGQPFALTEQNLRQFIPQW
ncbi:MAG: AAA family ATPase [Candidatus Levyibacteriota bacterium]